ncbi:hypothetical protein PSHT_12294 [Puccinia striiformis]|uniref:Uncharacterized protein n=1 Tax=Puccinia striiformis TaxID=27350 RepID=A0A2S4UXM4_9BASI|nr:hypothetical protein PSHT_12294 [Puccinia striiformis]
MANSKQRRNKAKALALVKQSSTIHSSPKTPAPLLHFSTPKPVKPTPTPKPSASCSTTNYHNPTSEYPSKSAKQFTAAQRRYGPNINIVLISISKSNTKKALVHLPYPNNNTKTVVTSSGYLPHLFIERHPFNSSPPDPTFKGLSRAIRDIFTMAKSRYQNKSNSNQLGGKMQMLGFCQASEKGISGGTYAYDQNLKKLDIANDLKLWDGLDAHNSFISGRVKSLYAWAYLDNTTL